MTELTTQARVGTRARLSGADRVIAGAIGGLLGGLLMGMWMMLEGLFDQGFFAAPTSIWAFWAGPGGYHPQDLEIVSLFLGLMGHMMNSAMIGVLAVLVGNFVARGALATLALSMIKPLIVMAIIFVAVLPLSPYGHFVYPDSAPLWAWIVGHLMFGFGMWLVAWPRLFRAQA